MLGDVPNLADLKLRFGGGATTQVVKRRASASRKLGQVLACSEDMLPVIKDVLSELPLWMDFQDKGSSSESWLVDLVIQPSRLDFVPKSFKTLRSTITNPSLDLMVQLGIGSHLKRRFKSFGLDLRDQRPNQDAAREGSITGALATLDLKSASDTLARELVFNLLPRDWYFFLSHFRSGNVLCEGVPVRMQKFSSMGNGFTFELESLIFFALALACVKDGDHPKVRVYGDDIIVPSYAYGPLCELLHYAGFIVNREKSFSDGPFRESCGADYNRGIDIRPSYVKDSLSLMAIFRLHNQYVRRGDPEAAEVCLSWIPNHYRKFGPDGYGDGHLIGDSGLTPFGRDRGFCGYTFETYTLRPVRDFSPRPGDRVYPFYSVYANADTGGCLTEGPVEDPQLLALGFKAISPGTHTYKKGLLGVSTPGTEGVNLIKIYTLSPRYS